VEVEPQNLSQFHQILILQYLYVVLWGNISSFSDFFTLGLIFGYIYIMGDYRYTELSYKITSLISRTCCLGSSGLTYT